MYVVPPELVQRYEAQLVQQNLTPEQRPGAFQFYPQAA